jgi:glycine C-acetyltransferase
MDEHRLWVSPIWFIAKPRLRITVNALHTREEMDQLVEAMVETRDVLYQPATTAIA